MNTILAINKKSSLAFLLCIALNGDIFAGFRAAPRSAVMESAGDARAAAEESFGQFLDCDARDQGRFFTHTSSCFAAAGCSCSSARLNRSEISALTESVQNGMTEVLPETKQHNITIS